MKFGNGVADIFSGSVTVLIALLLSLQKRPHLGPFTANGHVLRGVYRMIRQAQVKAKCLTLPSRIVEEKGESMPVTLSASTHS